MRDRRPLPGRHNVEVKELLDHGPGDAGEFIDTTGEGTIQIAPGVNSITITNTARGLLEICKAPIADLRQAATQPSFQFRIDGAGSPVVVQAGKCSPPRRVAVGTHTVTELNTQPNYELDLVRRAAASPSSRPDRELAKNLATKTVTRLGALWHAG